MKRPFISSYREMPTSTHLGDSINYRLYSLELEKYINYLEGEVKKLTIPIVCVAKRKVCSIEETPNSCSYYNRYRGCINCPKFVEQT